MKKSRVTAALVVLTLSFVLTWFVVLAAAETDSKTPPDPSSSLSSGPATTLPAREPVEDVCRNCQSVLLRPKEFQRFADEYTSWQDWLGGRPPTSTAPREELLVSVRAIAAIVPDLEVSLEMSDSDAITVSGNPASIGVLLDRLREHPLLGEIMMDSAVGRPEARSPEAASVSDGASSEPGSSTPFINVRNNWVTNIVWGQAAPGTTVHITLRRSASHVLTTTASANAQGLYHGYLAWEIRDRDVVLVDDGVTVRAVRVPPLSVSSNIETAIVTVRAVPSTTTPDRLYGVPEPRAVDVVVGKTSQSADLPSGSSFTAQFAKGPFRPGTRGFLRCTLTEGSRVYQPFSTPVVNVRRDTSYDLPYGSVHAAGLSSIVWGSWSPNSSLNITLTRPGALVVTRTHAADLVGNFAVSVDRLIEEGDLVRVSDGTAVRTVHVPTMTYRADGAAKTIAGSAPAGITSTEPSAPHSLQVTIAGDRRQITTESTGDFLADFSDRPYIAGVLGTMRYTTPSGDRVYKPIFVADPLVRGQLSDLRADTIIGQPDFSQITFNEVVGNKLFNPGGIHIDRSTQPNRIYLNDAGNNRVLGLSHLGECLAGSNAGAKCTSDLDCPASTCQVQDDRPADIVLGQTSANSSACNGDSGYQMYPDVPTANATTLCGNHEVALSVSEGGSIVTMATDPQGHLYVPDLFNNRVLRYNDPFSTDTSADHVWGQAGFAGVFCNRGASYGRTDARSLCLAPPPGTGKAWAGVAIDSVGNLWVADTQNNRVLRFPSNPVTGIPDEEADLVLGQPDFSTTRSDMCRGCMDHPSSVRVGENGVAYVADTRNNRVLSFEAPFSSGMSASHILESELREPTGLEFDPDGGLWVNDCNNRRFVRFVDDVLDKTVDSVDWRTWGGIGIDGSGNVVTAGWDSQQAHRLSPPSYGLDAVFLRAEARGIFNQTGARGLYGGTGLEVASGQLVYGDGSRMLFWNNPWSLSDYEAASGIVGQPDLQTRRRWGPMFGKMHSDDGNRLWVIRADFTEAAVSAYHLPLVTGATPVHTLTSPLPLRGGGIFTWTFTAGWLAADPNCDCLWLSDRHNNRVFRVTGVSSQHPVVDVVLGQHDVSGTRCNHGRDSDDGYSQPMYPSRDSLCRPGALAFDRNGNLYVSDHDLEIGGNWRLLVYDADTIPDASPSAIFGVPATRVFGRGDDFTEPHCLPRHLDPMCGPFEPAFDSRGRMVIGFNAYLGPRFPMVYQDPLTNPFPVAALADFHSMPLSARFDEFDNLYILDHNRSRVLIYRNREVNTSKVTGMIATETGDPVPGVHVQTAGYASSDVSDASGAYTLTGLITGTYEIVPNMPGYDFAPSSRTIHVPPSPGGQDFTACPPEEHELYLPVILRQH